MKYGYARVSTDDQTPTLQLAALKKAGCKTIFKDNGLFGATAKRSALLGCLKQLEPGDTLIVWKLDRLGRSLRHLIIMLANSSTATTTGKGLPTCSKSPAPPFIGPWRQDNNAWSYASELNFL